MVPGLGTSPASSAGAPVQLGRCPPHSGRAARSHERGQLSCSRFHRHRSERLRRFGLRVQCESLFPAQGELEGVGPDRCSAAARRGWCLRAACSSAPPWGCDAGQAAALWRGSLDEPGVEGGVGFVEEGGECLEDVRDAGGDVQHDQRRRLRP